MGGKIAKVHRDEVAYGSSDAPADEAPAEAPAEE